MPLAYTVLITNCQRLLYFGIINSIELVGTNHGIIISQSHVSKPSKRPKFQHLMQLLHHLVDPLVTYIGHPLIYVY